MLFYMLENILKKHASISENLIMFNKYKKHRIRISDTWKIIGCMTIPGNLNKL